MQFSLSPFAQLENLSFRVPIDHVHDRATAYHRANLFKVLFVTLLEVPRTARQVSIEAHFRYGRRQLVPVDNFVLRDIPLTEVDIIDADRYLCDLPSLARLSFVFRLPDMRHDVCLKAFAQEFAYIESQLHRVAAKGLLSGSMVCKDGGASLLTLLRPSRSDMRSDQRIL